LFFFFLKKKKKMEENNLVLNHSHKADRHSQPRHGTVLEANGGPEITTCFPFARPRVCLLYLKSLLRKEWRRRNVTFDGLSASSPTCNFVSFSRVPLLAYSRNQSSSRCRLGSLSVSLFLSLSGMEPDRERENDNNNNMRRRRSRNSFFWKGSRYYTLT
jgi:hypothetical protein